MLHELVHGAGFPKAHFALLRMHVDVDVTRIEREPERVGGLALVMQHVAVGFAQRMREHPVAHEAAVDEHVLAGHLRRVRRLHREAGDPERSGLGLDRRRALDEGVAEQRRHARAPAVRLQPVHHAAVVLQREPDVRVRERQAAEGLVAMPPFGAFRAQEFPPRRRVEVEFLHRHRRARRDRRGRRRAHAAAVDFDPPRVRGARRARGEREARHRGDRRQRLAAKAQRRDRLEVVRGRELRRRVPLDREAQVLAADAVAVVGHADAPDAAALEVDVDLRRARVERVLEQFLQRRRRALDDLARGDLVDEVVGQRSNSRHEMSRLAQSAGIAARSYRRRGGCGPPAQPPAKASKRSARCSGHRL